MVTALALALSGLSSTPDRSNVFLLIQVLLLQPVVFGLIQLLYSVFTPSVVHTL